MSATGTQPLSSLAGADVDRMSRMSGYRDMAWKNDKRCGPHSGYSSGYGNNSWAWGFLVFIILVIIIWVCLWVFNPDFLRKHHDDCDDHDHRDKDDKCCDVDGGKALLWAIVIALVIIFFIWIIVYAWGGWGGRRHSGY